MSHISRITFGKLANALSSPSSLSGIKSTIFRRPGTILIIVLLAGTAVFGALTLPGLVSHSAYADAQQPASVKYFAPVMLTNTQSVATPAGLQVQIRVNLADYQSYLSAYGENVEFYDSSWQPLYAWIESNAFCTSCVRTFWVKLDQSILPGQYAVVYLGFVSKASTYSASGYMGMAPELTGAYGYFDNGKLVFDTYDNFAGSTLGNMWSVFAYSGAFSATVNNGLTLRSTSSLPGSVQVYTRANAETVVDAPIAGASMPSGSSWDTGFETSVPCIATLLCPSDLGFTNAYRAEYLSGTNPQYRMIPDVAGRYDSNGVVESASSATGVASASWPSTGFQNMMISYSNSLSNYDGRLTRGTAYQFLALVSSSGSPSSVTYQWFRTRLYPPGGVMPAVAFLPVWSTAAGYDSLATTWSSAGASQNIYDQLILTLTDRYSLPNPMAIKAQVMVESAFNSQAVSPDAPCHGSHSYGLLQVTPGCDMLFGVISSGTISAMGLPNLYSTFTYCSGTCSQYYINEETSNTSPYWAYSVFNPVYSLNAGIAIMAQLYQTYLSNGCGTDQAYKMALSAYNGGPGTVSPSTCSYTDTNYVSNIMNDYGSLVSNSVAGWNQAFP